MESLKNWIAQNKTLAYVIGGVLAFIMLGKYLMPKPRRRRRSAIKVVNKPRRRVSKLTRSPKSKTVKKGLRPWQIKGSLAAKRRMAQIRRMK